MSTAKVKVVSAEGMKADTFWRHIWLRHPELRRKARIATLRLEHDEMHNLIPSALDHIHEPEPGSAPTRSAL